MTDYGFSKLLTGVSVVIILICLSIFFPVFRIIYAVLFAVGVILLTIWLLSPAVDDDVIETDNKSTKWITFD